MSPQKQERKVTTRFDSKSHRPSNKPRENIPDLPKKEERELTPDECPGSRPRSRYRNLCDDIDYIVCRAPFPELYNDRGKREKRAKVLYMCYCRAGKCQYSMSGRTTWIGELVNEGCFENPKWLYSMLRVGVHISLPGTTSPHYYFSNDNGNVQA
jgi:hypothetical protein